MKTDQMTFTIPKNKKGLKEELKRMKEEDSVNMSAFMVRAIEEKLGHVPKPTTMNCWACGTELIWGGDHNCEDYHNEEYNIVTNLSCPKCDAFVLVYHSPNDEYYED